MKSKHRIATGGQPQLSQSLAGLDGLTGLAANRSAAKPVAPQSAPAVSKGVARAKRGRLELRREKAGRGGKTVTTVIGPAWTQAPAAEREHLLAEIKRRCACGGRSDHQGFEVQGDQREVVEQVLTKAGFQVVRAGG